MAIFSPLRLRRNTDHTTELTQKFITFPIGQQWCALPIESLVKVIIMEENTNDSQPLGIKLTTYKGQQLVVWDVGRLLFGKTSFRMPALPDQHVLIGRMADDDVIGIPIDAPPVAITVSISALQPSQATPGITAVMKTAQQDYSVLDLGAIAYI